MRTIALLSLMGMLISSVCLGDVWPEYRGPSHDGMSDATALPLTWSETENVVWKTPINGRGWSSPVVWGSQIWITTAPEDGTELSAVCVSYETGEVLHQVKIFHNENPSRVNALNSYASCSPVIEEGRVYVHFGTFGTACLDTDTGEVLMLAYMNAESIRMTLESGYTHYWSRSRQKYWKKGETSGCLQELRELLYD